MKTTLTLWVEEEIKRKAKVLARQRKMSVSQLFAEFIEAEFRAAPLPKKDDVHRSIE